MSHRTLRADFLELGDGLTVREKKLAGVKGHFDPRTGEIAIHSEQSWEGKNVVLLHELLHATAEMLTQRGAINRRPDHAFIEAAAPTLLYLLVGAGVWSGLDRKKLLRWLNDPKNEKA